MKFRILIVVSLIASVISLGSMVAYEMTFAWIGCDGTVVSRTEA
jgi:hypothetical protein